ncbi:hypothetical protein R1flu_007909 [Riccia fluitans]|uniref:Elongator complex protein 4 n=1 Tax=Riccia fluitans TaxID=41844 RepID=A0ABD1Z129_9MARC
MDTKGRSFVRRAASSGGSIQAIGARVGPHGNSLVSSGLLSPLIGALQIIGGGIPIGGIVMVMEDLEAPHHLLLLRYFMAQGLAHGQPLLFASPLLSPRSFLGTLPGLAHGDESKSIRTSTEKNQEGGELRIAWQYRRFLAEQQELSDRRQRQQELTQAWSSSVLEQRSTSNLQVQDYNSKFDLRRPMERALFCAETVECVCLQGSGILSQLQEKCATFCNKLSRLGPGPQQVGRIALQSLCAPQCMLSLSEWEMMAFLNQLKSTLRKTRAVAFISFPPALLKPSFSARWQHLADVLLSVEAVEDDDKTLEAMLTDYRDIVGFLRVHKLASMNTQVPSVPEAGSYAIKVLHKRKVVLEQLQQAPIDASGDQSGAADTNGNSVEMGLHRRNSETSQHQLETVTIVERCY